MFHTFNTGAAKLLLNLSVRRDHVQPAHAPALVLSLGAWLPDTLHPGESFLHCVFPPPTSSGLCTHRVSCGRITGFISLKQCFYVFSWLMTPAATAGASGLSEENARYFEWHNCVLQSLKPGNTDGAQKELYPGGQSKGLSCLRVEYILFVRLPSRLWRIDSFQQHRRAVYEPGH